MILLVAATTAALALWLRGRVDARRGRTVSTPIEKGGLAE
jgi:hypothetical protein